ncbi:hypothetical protein SODG_005508 [Sodalis praecaptivus]
MAGIAHRASDMAKAQLLIEGNSVIQGGGGFQITLAETLLAGKRQRALRQLPRYPRPRSSGRKYIFCSSQTSSFAPLSGATPPPPASCLCNSMTQ